MMTLLLTFIYMAFISLGLPDGLLGAAWPVMHGDIGAALPLAGIVSAIITIGTIVSSLLSDRLTHRFGAGRVTAVSVLATATALWGFSCCTAFWQLCVWAIPYGLGAGAVDAALNNVIALHYRARHMSWLHCFWGIGASIGPYVMGLFLTGGNWGGGYRTIGAVQIVITAVLFASLPLWKHLGRVEAKNEDAQALADEPLGTRGALKVRGVKPILFAFFAYGAAEMLAMLWASSYMHEYRGFDADTAASLASLFYLGMTVGRFFNGFLAERFNDKTLIRCGLLLTLVGVAVLLLPPTSLWAALGLLIVGLGCAPVYPCIIHATPIYFGRNRSQAIIGLEMAGAYSGSFLIPPLFGVLADHLTLGLFPYAIGAFILLSLTMTERVNRTMRKELI